MQDASKELYLETCLCSLPRPSLGGSSLQYLGAPAGPGQGVAPGEGGKLHCRVLLAYFWMEMSFYASSRAQREHLLVQSKFQADKAGRPPHPQAGVMEPQVALEVPLDWCRYSIHGHPQLPPTWDIPFPTHCSEGRPGLAWAVVSRGITGQGRPSLWDEGKEGMHSEGPQSASTAQF